MAYDGSGGVKPSNRAMLYNLTTKSWTTDGLLSEIPMDLRGSAFTNPGTAPAIIGGMDSNQNVLNSAYQLSYENVSSIGTTPSMFTNYHIENSKLIVDDQQITSIRLYNTHGQLIGTANSRSISVEKLRSGIYIVQLYKSSGFSSSFKIGL
jgi:hypothetical protein